MRGINLEINSAWTVVSRVKARKNWRIPKRLRKTHTQKKNTCFAFFATFDISNQDLSVFFNRKMILCEIFFPSCVRYRNV